MDRETCRLWTCHSGQDYIRFWMWIDILHVSRYVHQSRRFTILTHTDNSTECQQSNPKPFACYDSEANDVWSLGVILVNLTCGRNPWKRAAMDDSTFRAFVRNRDFLQTILPISDGLNAVLQRIFQTDPKRRIGLGELRQLILECPQLGQDSTDASLPPSPPYSPVEKPVDSPLAFYGNGPESVPNFDPLPVQQFPQYPTAPFDGPRPSFAAGNLPTPPGSTLGSPRQPLYTYQPKPAPPVFCGTFASGASYIPSFSSWSRCSNFVPNFANQACWRNVLVS
jgi:serine/threonine protein kinase